MENGIFYTVATPIGNLEDISHRAIKILGAVSLICAEDTRHTKILLSHLGISNKVISLNAHNESEKCEYIESVLQKGDDIALVSDAGTPLICDPGAAVVSYLHEKKYQICPVPGASAITAALSASGVVESQFHFLGFLSSKKSVRERKLQEFVNTDYALVMYEAPHRIRDCLDSLRDIFGEYRKMILVKELTKIHEKILRGTVEDVIHWLDSDPLHQKGEFVLIIQGVDIIEDNLSEAKRILEILLEVMSSKDAVKLAQQITGISKNKIYALVK